MTHLTADELIDAMEADADHSNAADLLPPERRSHLATCEACQRELAGLSAVLGAAQQIEVPEPSPLFWPHFSERVRTAVEHEGLPGTGVMPAWWRWQVLAPVGAFALLLLALMMAVPKPERSAPDVPPEAAAAVDAPGADERWVMVENLVGDFDWETAREAGLTVKPGAADQAVVHLTAEEQQELTRLLKAELMRAKS
jgi:hypothetical protein